MRIARRDALTRTLDRAAKAELGLSPEGFDIILANPPFSGRLATPLHLVATNSDRIKADVVYRFRVIRAGSRS